ncbi:YadA-like family protein [Actinobacillus equuli subsp. haemolyticus]|uniref:YadA-like family protein n=1 Tax=Actinobacillus equuli TaxID=718 RepID=UPI0024432694|nr:YadA-like family protein [Actinobacillus equuli]WGE62513.1 YadA-like family protein [Actinobacillus equuli subsp. haemolyticus]
MNRIFKVIRNHTTRSCVVASEFAKSKNTVSSSSGNNTNAQTSSKRLLNLGALTTSTLQATAIGTIVIGSFASTDANAAIAISNITADEWGIVTGIDKTNANAEVKGDIGTSPYNYYNPGSLSYSAPNKVDEQQERNNQQDMYDNNGSFGIAIGNNTNAIKNNHSNGIAIGDYANATGGLAVAIGAYSRATDVSAMALGTASRASGYNSLAIMRQSAATGNFSVAIGSVSYAKGNASFAMGASATAFGNQSIAIGSVNPTTTNGGKAPVTTYDAMNRTQTNGDRSMALGSGAKTSGDDSFAIGSNAETGTFKSQKWTINGAKDNKLQNVNETVVATKAAKAIAFGNNAKAKKDEAIAFGTNATAHSNASIAFGNKANVTGNISIAFGNESTAIGDTSIAFGKKANATGKSAIAFGADANATGNFTLAVGDKANAKGNMSMAIGQLAHTKGESAIAFGSHANATAMNATAIGTRANASKNFTIALGDNSQASAINATAIGYKADANVNHSVALGFNSTTTAGRDTDNAIVNGIYYGGFAGNKTFSVVSVGSKGQERQIQHVAAGNISATSTDAINGSQLYLTQQTLGNVANSLNITLGGNSKLHPNGTINITNIGNTGKNNIHEAIMAVNNSVAEGKNVKVEAKKDPNIGNITYTVNAWNTTVEGINDVNVTSSVDPENYTLNYKVDLSQSAKNNITLANTTAHNANATVNKGWNITTNKTGTGTVNGNTKHNVKMGTTITLIAGDNINISQDSANITIATSKTPTFTQITVGQNTSITDEGLKITEGPSITKTGIDAGNKVITNVANGTNGTDAVNLNQLNASRSFVVEGKNTNITSTSNENGTTYTVNSWNTTVKAGSKEVNVTENVDKENYTIKYTFDLSQDAKNNITNANNTANIANNTVNKGWNITTNKTGTGTVAGNKEHNVKMGTTITLIAGDNINITQDTANITIATSKTPTFTNITVGTNTTIDDHGLTIKNGPSITQNGINAGNKVITNVAEGVNGTDAVNLNQLQKVNATANAGWKLQANHANSSTVKPNHTVSLNNTDGNIIISKATDDHNVTFGLNHTITIGGPNKPGDTQGKDGSLTVKSADGKSGVSLNGKDGSIGLNGKDGENATISIAKGADGLDGKNGANGKTRIVYHTPNGDKEEVATLNDGLNFVGDDGKVVAKKLNQTLTIKGNLSKEASVTDQNLRVDNHNGELIIKMAKSLRDLANATFVDGANSTVIDGNGLIISGGPSITRHGINAGNRVITNVAAGVNGTDAVNVDQLKRAAAAATTTLENSNTTTVQSHLGKNGQPVYRVEVNKAPITVNNDGIANTEAGDVNNSFATVGDVVNALNNVSWTIQGNGETKDQVTAGNKVNFINGNGTTAVVNTNAEGTVTNVSFNVNTSSMAFNSTSGKIDVGDSNGFATAGDVAKAIKDAELTSTVVAGSNLKVSSTVNSNNTEFKVSLANNLDLTDQGSVKIGDTTLNKDGLKVGDTSVSKDGVKVGDINITKDGINAGGKKITNLANGTEATDAVNLSQLKASTAAAKTELTNGTTTTVNSVQGKDGQTIYSVEVNKAPVTVNSTTGIAETSANPAAANNSFATVTDVVNALNNISWSVNSTAVAGTNGVSSYQQTSDSKISAGDSVNYKAGQNIVLSGSGNNLVIATNPDSTFDSVTAKNQVTVGSVNIASSGKISGVADGDISPISTEAVNGSQLYATHQNIADYLGGNASLDANGALQAPTYTINKTDGTTVTAHNVGDALGHLNNEVIKPLTFAGDIGTPSERPLGSTIALTGGVTEESQLSDNNIGVTSDGKGTINVKLAKDIKVNSVNANTVTVGDTKIDSDGISIHNGPSVTKSGINAAGNKITNVKAGEADTDAVNVSQLKGVANNINNRINAVNNKVDRIDQNLRAGVASAIASGSLYHVTLPGKSMLAAGVGTYKGQSAIAVGYSRLSDNGKIGVKVSVNSNTRGDTGAGASIGYQW